MQSFRTSVLQGREHVRITDSGARQINANIIRERTALLRDWLLRAALVDVEVEQIAGSAVGVMTPSRELQESGDAADPVPGATMENTDASHD